MKRFGLKTGKPQHKRGLVAIELALGFFGFWLICLVWIEMSYVAYVSALGDIVITQASSQAKRGDDNFQAVFEGVIKNDDSIWSNVVTPDNFTSCVRYIDTFENLAALNASNKDICSGGSVGDSESKIAIYRINYDYTPMFTSIFGSHKGTFTREMIVIQESKI